MVRTSIFTTGIASLSDSLILEHQILLCHDFDVELLIESLLLFVEAVQFQVQRLIEQLEILQTSLDIAVFPDQACQSADAVQRLLDFVVA